MDLANLSLLSAPYVLLITLSATLIAIQSLHPIAPHFGLVDTPDHRKVHKGNIPLIGGIAVFFGIALTSSIISFQDHVLYLSCAATIVITGAIDDARDLSVKIRLIIQAAISLLMCLYGNYQLSNLGDLLNLGSINIGAFAPVLTVIAVIGAINAFNMIDGIDGLAGSLSLITFLGMAILFAFAGQDSPLSLSAIFIAGLIPYLMANLTVKPFKRKIFMGDAGSMLIGFTVIWLLIIGTQDDTPALRPVTALWLIAIPLMDMAAIMVRRMIKGQSPFKPDRDHLHHIFMRAGCTSREALAFISTISIILMCIGIIGEVLSTPEWIMLVGFLCVFFAYQYAMQHIWRLITFYHKFKKQPTHPK